MSNNNYKLVSGKGKNAGKQATAAKKPVKKTANKTVKKVAKKPAKGKSATVILMSLLLLVAGSIVALGFYVGNLDVVFPNVHAGGVNLAGLTIEQARQKLISTGYENNADGVAATINFPDGSGFSISGEEAGFALDAFGAAKAAFDYGRSGSFFANEFAFIRTFLKGVDLHEIAFNEFDENYVRERVSASTRSFNDTLTTDAYKINSNSIEIVKGITFSPAEESDVHALTVETLLKAMAEKSQLSADYTPQQLAPKEVDLQLLHSNIYVEAVSAEYDPETFSASQSITGVTFDIDAARKMLDNAGMGERLIIPLIAVEPEVTTEDLEELLFRDILAESTTVVGGNSNRVGNVRLSSSSIDGTMLNPGDMFSFNDIVGQRTAERGYREAGAYVGNLMVQEIGGGICQTSSTIYYSVLKADLLVMERQPHNMTVGYLPLGCDATINWGTIDLKFRNNTDYPIKIEMEMEGTNLTARLMGTKLDDTYVKVGNTTVSSTAYEEIEREDESIAEGERKVYTDGATGFVVDTYKYYYDADDNLIDTVYVGRSTYVVQHRIILVPPASEETEEIDEIDEFGEFGEGEQGEGPVGGDHVEGPQDGDFSGDAPTVEGSTETTEFPEITEPVEPVESIETNQTTDAPLLEGEPEDIVAYEAEPAQTSDGDTNTTQYEESGASSNGSDEFWDGNMGGSDAPEDSSD